MAGEQATTSNFLDERHNLYCGWVFGMALKHGLPIEPIGDDAGNFTDRFAMALPDGITLTLVIPPPPDEWTLDAPPPRARRRRRSAP